MGVRFKVLGRTGLKVSAVGCGTNVLRMQTQENADRVLNYALDKGINFIETGRPYGPTEEMIGKAISHRRDDFFIAAKTIHHSYEEALKEVAGSLEALRTSYIDLYEVIFGRSEELERILSPQGALKGLLKAKETGSIGFVGVGGHRPDLLAEALVRGDFDTVLFHFNMAQPYALGDLIPTARRLGAGTMVMRPIGHGALAPAAKSLRFPLACPGVDLVLCGMYSLQEVDEDLAAAEPQPTDDEWSRLLAEVEALRNTGCRLCEHCSPCPKGISIGYIMTYIRYRSKYSLLPQTEEDWRPRAEKAEECDGCGLCEKRCPYSLSIIPIVREAASTV